MRAVSITRWLPVWAAVAVLATAGPLAWSRDFAVFLFAWFCYGPALLLVCLCLVIWAIVDREPARRWSALAAVLAIVAAASTAYFGARVFDHDRLAFLFWHPLHRQLVDRFADTDGIILTWDSWGIAGMENDSYLVSNPSDTISDIDAASKWARRYSDCEIVNVKRMRPGLYILTTYNCPLE
ncbi:MAG TPA: hypothetical protein VMC10_22795 [Stellaceae bacterium]|nr:hypothetical protein [Stellaceae bacterium]